ncbi:hypothetical protein PYCCODRAFT_1437671 [Trametes coccinea BRFM310]|uniref:DUF6533 domain-containing protein n=1 Tax=Trametes coccinea (strain BRFM310) TaxID=1353009 RepID=A0A1Y2IFZ5_TRAC3|nr:hypothetical protein PYCCODRAFT_1437671 [Trametes coccinea BRFM310]
MSSNADEVAEIIAFYESVFVNTCCPIAVLAFLTYEYLITFDSEVGLFWRSKFTGASALFLTNRYWPLLVNILNITSSARMSDQVLPTSCDAYVKALQTIELLQYFPWAAFSALRTYALSRGNRALSILVFFLSIVPMGVNFSQYHWLVVINDPTIGCSKSSTISADMAKRLTIASRTCLIAADVIVLLVTWTSTFGTIRIADAALKGRPSFVRLLVRDGAFFNRFVLCQVMSDIAFITNDALSPVSYFTTFTEPITAVLVSRFLLNLQEVNQYNQRSSLSTVSLTQSVTLDFASRIVGSLGSSLETGHESSRMSSNAPPSYADDDMMWDLSDLSPRDHGEAHHESTDVAIDV